MTEEEEKAAAAAAAPNKDEKGEEKKKKKKKVRAPPPPTPPAVVTGYLVLRTAVMGVLGLLDDPQKADNTAECYTSPFQATFLKEGNLSGKFSMSISKNMASRSPLLSALSSSSSNSFDLKDILTAVQHAVNRMLVEPEWSIRVVETTLQEAQESSSAVGFGLGCLDESLVGKKSKVQPDAKLRVAQLSYKDKIVYSAACPGAVVLLEEGQEESSVNNNNNLPYKEPSTSIAALQLQAEIKIARKSTTQISLKFVVIQEAAAAAAAGCDDDPSSPPPPHQLACIVVAAAADNDISSSRTPSSGAAIFPEGQALVDQIVAAAAAEMKPAATAPAATTTTSEAPSDEAEADNDEDDDEDVMIVNTETVSGKIDYNKLVEQFGSTIIDDEVMRMLTAETVGKGRVPHLHRFLRRNIFFSHRDLHTLLTQMQKSTSTSNGSSPMYLYTGRGPSSSAMHLGHLVPFLFTRWLQQALDCPCVIQMTDDEKFIFKGQYDEELGMDNLQHYADLTMENARDIIACGFDYDKTFIFSDLDYVGTMYPNICRIWKAVTTNTVNGIFGFDGSSNTGKIAFPAVQAAPSFASSFPVVLNEKQQQSDDDNDQKKQSFTVARMQQTTPDNHHLLCLIPCAIDQDPYFRMTRDVAHKLIPKKGKTVTDVNALGGKPALIHSKFFPPLQGATGKMSSSDSNSAIFLTDTAQEIKDKITKFAFSGGRETKRAQEEFGANLDVDVSYQWLRFFLEDDDELARIGKDYSTGSGQYWSTTKVKERLIVVLQKLVAEHQERRAKITDEEVRKWMMERSIM